MEILWVCLFVLATGACIGSFLNVVALRALTKESIVFPSSKCPKCSTPIKWYDNIPVFSYFFTFKGKCRSCGESVSKQYPIVEALTSILFLIMFFAFGFTLKTLFLLILLCIAIVIIITDIKKEYVFESHAWVLIIFSIGTALYLNGVENYAKPIIGLIVGFIAMEALAKLSYYLIRKKTDEEKETDKIDDETEETPAQTTDNAAENSEQKQTVTDIDDENFDINEYVKQKKRAFGEGDTYLAAASGALLGWKYFFVAMFLSIIIQALCVLPQFIIGLYKQKQYRLLISLSSFIVLAIIYWIITNLIEMNLYMALSFVVLLLFFAIDTITRLKRTVNAQGFSAIPFGPSLLIATFLVLFFGQDIVRFLLKYIFI